jgi:hypothetical protein
MNPLLYGAMRVAGNVIWQTDLQEHSHTESAGGKGGGGGDEVTTYTYSASFAVRLCEGPVDDITKIWANGRLIFGQGSDAKVDVPVKFYYGTEEQLPDPTMEAVLGVGNVPAYRGVVYAVFTDWDLSQFGNVIPNLNFEVVQSAGSIPWRVSTFDGFPSGNTSAWLDTETEEILVGRYYAPSSGTLAYEEKRYTLQGEQVGETYTVGLVDEIRGRFGLQVEGSATNAPILMAQDSPDEGGVTDGWYYRGQFVGHVNSDPGDFAPVPGYGVFANGSVLNGYLYGTCDGPTFGASAVARWPLLDSGVPSTRADRAWLIPAYALGDDINFAPGDNGKLYVATGGNGDPEMPILWELSADLEVLRDWTPTDLAAVIEGGGANWTRAHDFIIYNQMLVVPTGTLNFYKLSAWRLGTWEFVGEMDVGPNPAGPQQIVRLGNTAYGIGTDGVFSLAPPIYPVTLASIVADLSRRSGLADTDFDVTQLEEDLVDGYLVTQQGPTRGMLQPLRDAYFFDAVESDDVVKFVKRGNAIAAEIPDDDLAAHTPDEEVPPILATVRMQEVDLPATVNVDYVNAAADYQTGTQRARRITTQSEAEVSLNLLISMTDEKAKSVADIQLYSAWLERNRHAFRTAMKWARLEPTDVVRIQGKEMRITNKKRRTPGVLLFDAVAHRSQVYTHAGHGAAAGEGMETIVVEPRQPTTLVLFDLPLGTDADIENGLYAGVRPTGTGTWPGASIFKSSDSGNTYQSIAAITAASTLGTASTVLGDFVGGNTVDEANSVTVVLSSGSLASVTYAALLNGANRAVLGDEVFGFRSATLVAENTYVLSGLLRGRRGTEWAMGSHATGETFALLSTLVRIDAPFSELGSERLYKAVTSGAAIVDAASQAFTNNGRSLKPYAPVHVRGGPIAVSGSFDGTVQIDWTRRTRIGGAWLDLTDVPLSEVAERYIVEVWDSTYTQCAGAPLGDGEGGDDLTTHEPTVKYPAAWQVTDFGALQKNIYVTVAQRGAYGIGPRARGVIPGLGAADTAPLNPVPPYGS